jgi:hypothetical protein
MIPKNSELKCETVEKCDETTQQFDKKRETADIT